MPVVPEIDLDDASQVGELADAIARGDTTVYDTYRYLEAKMKALKEEDLKREGFNAMTVRKNLEQSKRFNNLILIKQFFEDNKTFSQARNIAHNMNTTMKDTSKFNQVNKEILKDFTETKITENSKYFVHMVPIQKVINLMANEKNSKRFNALKALVNDMIKNNSNYANYRLIEGNTGISVGTFDKHKLEPEERFNAIIKYVI